MAFVKPLEGGNDDILALAELQLAAGEDPEPRIGNIGSGAGCEAADIDALNLAGVTPPTWLR